MMKRPVNQALDQKGFMALLDKHQSAGDITRANQEVRQAYSEIVENGRDTDEINSAMEKFHYAHQHATI